MALPAGVSRDSIRAIYELLAGGSAVLDSDGDPISPDSYAQVLTYNGDDTVNTIAFTDGTTTWTQTFSYTSGNVTGISKWVAS